MKNGTFFWKFQFDLNSLLFNRLDRFKKHVQVLGLLFQIIHRLGGVQRLPGLQLATSDDLEGLLPLEEIRAGLVVVGEGGAGRISPSGSRFHWSPAGGQEGAARPRVDE